MELNFWLIKTYAIKKIPHEKKTCSFVRITLTAPNVKGFILDSKQFCDL